MRRLIASIVLAGLACAAAAPLAAAIVSPGKMACCRTGGKMACCVPSSGCEMKSCPAGDRDPILPGLAAAVLLDSPSHEIDLALCPDRIASVRVAAATLALPPPE